jgi:hypothetical protein
MFMSIAATTESQRVSSDAAWRMIVEGRPG